ncbi:M48 family metalloprotease [Polynucleobacter sp. UK-Kesae-W10]|uniref:M48 family metalloprotease n=1 Tax=Polynucleobacter sp. UK-Kesae-W10 TaxID=1819738 RepID=UPI001C0B238A|nr:M48 family metalloprotease [Polynucleobacter sp. UK-Kesae-W10]MBU3578109.1 M48 family metallopeptidase [Polynucleobacter sp. UK-Kesae-W10]
MQDIKHDSKTPFRKRLLVTQLSLVLAVSSITPAFGAPPAGDVSVQGNSAALQNIGRAMQSPDARSANLPTRNNLPSQPNIVLPDMGDPGGDSLSRIDERKYGELIMREIRPDPDYSNDLPLYDYLNQMERRLIQTAKKLQLGGANEQGSGAYNFEIFAVKDSSINAFALPGGFIGFHTGLIVDAETDSEVASVMGHETGHVLQRHLARQMDKQATNTMIALAGMVLGALAMSRNPQAAAGLMQGGQAAAINNQLSYSRDAEREADRVGFQILNSSGYDVNGAPDFFQRLQKITGIMDKGVPTYVRTHPLTTDRIADMQDRVRSTPQYAVPATSEFYFIKARARMEQAGSSSGLYDLKNTFDSLSKQAQPGKQMEGFYGLALIAQRQGKIDVAETNLQQARNLSQKYNASNPSTARPSLALDIMSSELALAKGKNDEALQIAQAALRSNPQSYAAAVAMINADLKLGKTNDAITWLKARTKAQPNEIIWWSLLSKAYDQANNIPMRHYALGEKYALEGAWPSALEQMRIARSAAGSDFYQGSTIDARLREMQRQYNDELKEKKQLPS